MESSTLTDSMFDVILERSQNGTKFDFNHSFTRMEVEEKGIVRRSILSLIIIGTILGLIIMTTILGNLLVMVTILTNKKLQCQTNFFVFSLATTDFCLGCLVLPFSAVNTLHYEWPLGWIFCNIYTATDVALCTVSILNLFAISLDRYLAITKPMRYQQRASRGLVKKISAAIWLFSFLIGFIPVHLGWNTPSGEVQNRSNPSVCGFELNPAYALLVSLGTYFAPLIVMCAVYTKVLMITRHQVKEINKLTVPAEDLHRTMLNQKAKKKDHKAVSERKATITLASLVACFGICWIPYFTLFMMKPFLKSPPNLHLDLFFLWLGYLNSSINPFLYAYYNTTFRHAFIQILCRGCKTRLSPCHEFKLKNRHLGTVMNDNMNGSSSHPLDGKSDL